MKLKKSLIQGDGDNEFDLTTGMVLLQSHFSFRERRHYSKFLSSLFHNLIVTNVIAHARTDAQDTEGRSMV
jgi:hypothetical protein